MLTFMDAVKVMCFAASYAVAFVLEFWHLFRPRPILRYLALGFGGVGLLAQIIYMVMRAVPLGSPTGSLLFLALILVVFYLGEALHHQRIAWALFVLPVVLSLITLAEVVARNVTVAPADDWSRTWGIVHGTLVLLSAVGVAVGFIASIMYLVQSRRLQAKLPPSQGLPLFNLERLEQMNRNALLWSFPLLTAGLATGVALLLGKENQVNYWQSPRILSLLGVWLVSMIVFYLRYRVHVRGRQLAVWTMFAFAILIVALIFPHSFDQGVE
jgi:ABC-type uncharacterized transport system permease subunit